MYKSLIIFAFTFIILSCSKKSQNEKNKDITVIKKQLSLERERDINSIVESIIVQDSLPVLKFSDYSNFLCYELRKLPIDFPEKQKNGLIPPPAPGRIYLNEILNDTIENDIFFTTKDSSNLIAQNSNPLTFRIEKSILKNINSTSFQKEILKKRNGKAYRFYEITIPLFSLDNQKAYVELGYYCGTLCGYGEAIYLKKINGKWTIVEKMETWIS